MRDSKKGVERGQSITFRVPSDTPDHLLKQLQKLKETEKRNFSSKIAHFVMQGVSDSLTREKETITIPLPKALTKEQRNWMKHEHSEALIGSIVYQLLIDPVRATTLLASLNSNAYDIEEALYLQEEMAQAAPAAPSPAAQHSPMPEPVNKQEEIEEQPLDDLDQDDDLDDLNWDALKSDMQTKVEEEEEVDEEDDDDLLGDFFASMNK